MKTRSGQDLLTPLSDAQPWEQVDVLGVISLVPADSSGLERLKTDLWRRSGNSLYTNTSSEQTDLNWEASGATIIPQET